MPRRTVVIFWAAVAAAVAFLGAGWATWQQGRGGAQVVVLTIAGIGLAASGLVAGRIVVVVAGLQRRARHDNASSPSGRAVATFPRSGEASR